jgi:hypothetical protein
MTHPLEKIIRGTLRLHDLINHGLGESPEADAARDEMDDPWLELNESEQEAARMVSAAVAHGRVCENLKSHLSGFGDASVASCLRVLAMDCRLEAMPAKFRCVMLEAAKRLDAAKRDADA